MEDSDVQAGLRDLSASLDKIKELLAWQELAEAERRPGLPPSFQISDHVVDDLRFHFGFFLTTAMDAHEILNSDDLQAGQVERMRWQQQLFRLENEVRILDVAERLKRA